MKLSFRKQLEQKPKSFDELLENDPFGLLDNVGEKRLSMSVSEKVKSAFEEIADFVKTNQRLPSLEADDFDEELLAEKYFSLIKISPEGQMYCESFLPENKNSQSTEISPIFEEKLSSKEEELQEQIDRMETKSYNNIDDIFNDDPLGLLSDVGDVCVENESWKKDREESSNSVDGQIAKPKTCKEFYKYQRYFDEINRLLSEGHLEAVDIHDTTASIELGDVFVVNGMMSLIAEVNDLSHKIKSSRKLTYRVRQIFANGTESSPLSTSIKTTFYSKADSPGRRIVSKDYIGIEFLESMKIDLERLSSGSSNVMTGYVYILSSRSTNPTIRGFAEQSKLVKIGYCTTDVKTRIANAENEPTYLCAPVNVIRTYECYNFDPKNLEDVLHTILASHRLNVELKDKNGTIYRPKEWFTVSFQTAIEIVEHLFAGDLSSYYIDNIQGKLKRK